MVIETDAYVDGMHDTREPVWEESTDQLFTWQELARLDEALTMASRETGLRFTLYIGDLGKRTRIRAEELFGQSGGDRVTRGWSGVPARPGAAALCAA